jgi:hypothetical protein
VHIQVGERRDADARGWTMSMVGMPMPGQTWPGRRGAITVGAGVLLIAHAAVAVQHVQTARGGTSTG